MHFLLSRIEQIKLPLVKLKLAPMLLLFLFDILIHLTLDEDRQARAAEVGSNTYGISILFIKIARVRGKKRPSLNVSFRESASD